MLTRTVVCLLYLFYKNYNKNMHIIGYYHINPNASKFIELNIELLIIELIIIEYYY